MKRVAILQSNYIPWKGYFDIIHDVDTFIFYDDVQYTTGDWRNRNRIKTERGAEWLTIPVGKHIHRRLCDVALPEDRSWADAHWRRIAASYRSAPYFREYRDYFEPIFRNGTWVTLSDLNQALVIGIARDLFGLKTEFQWSGDYDLEGAKGGRLIQLLKQSGAEHYVSGPAARGYITDEEFAEAGIGVTWKDYANYPDYAQLHGAFQHEVSILDLLFQTGPSASWHIWGWRESQTRQVAA